MHLLRSRAIATVAAAAILLTTAGLQPALADHDDHDNAAAVARFAAILGTLATIVAAERHRHRSYDAPPYAYGPVYRGPVHRHHHRPWRHHRHW
jgi:hypothetical protein